MTQGTRAGGEGTAPRGEHPDRHLAEPLLALDLAAELGLLYGDEPWPQGGRHARTLIKDRDLRVVLIAMHAGARLAAHHAPGRITIQPLRGRITVGVGARRVELAPDQLLTLGPGVVHDVEAQESSAFLLTIAWPN